MNTRSPLACSISVAILILLSAAGWQPSSASPAFTVRADRDGPWNFRTPRADRRSVSIIMFVDGDWPPPPIGPEDDLGTDISDLIVIDPDEMIIPIGPAPK